MPHPCVIVADKLRYELAERGVSTEVICDRDRNRDCYADVFLCADPTPMFAGWPARDQRVLDCKGGCKWSVALTADPDGRFRLHCLLWELRFRGDQAADMADVLSLRAHPAERGVEVIHPPGPPAPRR